MIARIDEASRERPRARRKRSVTPRYLNRELSWLDFNERVLQLAEDESVPLLERVKFCAIRSGSSPVPER